MALITNTADLIRMYLANSGQPMAVPEGMGDLRSKMADPVKALQQAPLAPGYVPGGGTIVPTDTGGGAAQRPQPLQFDKNAYKAPEAKIEEESIFKTPQGWKDRKDTAIDRARKALDEAAGKKTPDPTAGVPDRATATTPETQPAMTPTQGPDTGAPNPNMPAVPAPTQQSFVRSMTPLVAEAAEQTGLDPRLIMAQAILESGYGANAPGHNYFGIKSHGRPGGQTLMTTEVVDGKSVRKPESFRVYASPSESVRDYAGFIKENPIYAKAQAAKGIEAQIAAMAPYATDPNYIRKLREIVAMLPAPQPVVSEPDARKKGGQIKPKGNTNHVRDLLALSRNYK
jgi:flagellum-specific peptidoglycan hydrolase FlgJ